MTAKQMRAVGYCRTSGEGQRDNTSIGSQKEAIGAFCQRNDWALGGHYIDECRSGAKVAGRDEFQRLMRDAALEKFDIVVVYQLSRWGRDGADIIDSCRTLKRDFAVDVVETSGAFDTRKPMNALMNFVGAGVAEHERLSILQRTSGGRMARAKAGLPWSGNFPVGRAYDPTSGKWCITDRGRDIAAVLQRYADGESLTKVAAEHGIKNGKGRFSKWVAGSQLAGTYQAHFQSRGIALDERILMPAIPEVVSPALLERVKARMAHNRRWNRTDAIQYRLVGFLFCKVCGRALGGRTDKDGRGGPHTYYKHHGPGRCGFAAVRGEQLEEAVLDALYTFFRDEPRFDRALQAAMPSAEQRDDLEKQRQAAAKRVAEVEGKIRRLVNAVAAGADVGLLLGRQEALKAELASAQERVAELDNLRAETPSAYESEQAARLLRLDLEQRFRGEDWRALDCAGVKNFLHHLFGANPRKAGTGIFVTRTAKAIEVELRGAIELGFLGKGHLPPGALESEEMATLKKTSREWQSSKGKCEKLGALIETIEAGKAAVVETAKALDAAKVELATAEADLLWTT